MFTAKFSATQQSYSCLKKRTYSNRKRKSQKISMILFRSASERFLLSSSIHCSAPTVKWVQRQISYNDEGGKIIVNLHVSAFCFYCFGCAFCRAIKAWKNLQNKQMLFFNPLALGKECLEILTFSVKGIKTKQKKQLMTLKVWQEKQRT